MMMMMEFQDQIWYVRDDQTKVWGRDTQMNVFLSFGSLQFSNNLTKTHWGRNKFFYGKNLIISNLNLSWFQQIEGVFGILAIHVSFFFLQLYLWHCPLVSLLLCHFLHTQIKKTHTHTHTFHVSIFYLQEFNNNTILKMNACFS